MSKSDLLLARVRNHESLSGAQQRSLILSLSLPAILAQLSATVMQIIDASMVGRLGLHASASIGLISSTTWLLGRLCSGATYGFSVQTAQAIGAKDNQLARHLCRQGLIASLLCALIIGGIGFLLSFSLPAWLGGEEAIRHDATMYLAIYCLCFPFNLLNTTAVAMLQAAGDTKLPSLCEIVICFLDVLFNSIFIFGMHMGVAGSALGTGAALACGGLFLTGRLLRQNPTLKGRCKPHFTRHSVQKAIRIGLPVSAESSITGLSYVILTRIMSPLGSAVVAAHSFAVTAESLCYMPAFGCAEAATAIIGQCCGANRKELSRELTWRLVHITLGMMVGAGFLLFVLARVMMMILTSDPSVIDMGVSMLRLEAFAEPLYGASIVAVGILRGKGETLWPAILNFVSIWCIRLPLSWFLAKAYGYMGIWMAMGFELDVRGIVFLLRLRAAFGPKKEQQEPENA